MTTPPPPAPPGPLVPSAPDAWGSGPTYLRRGWELLRRRPGLLLLGMVPAFVVFLVLGALFVWLLLNLGSVAAWLTPFADGWAEVLRVLLRIGVGIVLVLGAVLLWTATFTAITLTVGDPFYEKIWRECEQMLGPTQLGDGVGLWRSVADGLKLAGLGLLMSLVVIASGFVPLVGPLLGIVLGVVLSGRLLGRELMARPLEGRDLDGRAQQALLEPHRRTVHGFGVSVQLCFLVPLGGVLVTPIAVAGATVLARDVLTAAAPPPPGEWSAAKPR